MTVKDLGKLMFYFQHRQQLKYEVIVSEHLDNRVEETSIAQVDQAYYTV